MVAVAERVVREIKVSEYTISAKDIHPSLLKGLIPVDQRSFISCLGENIEVKIERVDVTPSMMPQTILYSEGNDDFFPLIHLCVCEALNRGWEYLYQIRYVVEKLDPGTFEKMATEIKILGV